MATIHGARALGMEGFIGELSPGAHADAIAIPYAGGIDDLLESIVQHRGDVAASMIGGEWAVSPESIASKAAVA
jgi:cytosine/adenosine deaminase-related metal-dependent hydrolase